MELKIISDTVLLLTICHSIIATYLDEHKIRSLKKRAILNTLGDEFHVINVTFACNRTEEPSLKEEIRSLLEREEEILIRRVETLSEEDMRSIMRFKGGSMMPEYLASSEETVHKLPDPKVMRFNSRFLLTKQRLADKILIRNPQATSTKNELQAKAQSVRNILHGQSIFGIPTYYGSLGTHEKTLKRKKRDTLVDLSCSEAGETTEIDENYVHLCKICSGKRYLPPDRYPRYVNEVLCAASENGCLGDNNGKCVETKFNAHLLKRKDGQCTVCIKDSEVLAVDQWDIYVEPIRVGCECILNKRSNYRQQWFSAGTN